jgi:GNAT superfamily N-acetyltransferase
VSDRLATDCPVSDPLAALLGAVAAGAYPVADGSVTIVPQPSARDAGVIAFTAHAVIFTGADPAWVRGQLPAGDLSGPLTPRFLQALCDRTGRRAQSADLLTVAPSCPGPPAMELTPDADPAHPRIARALRCRDDVRAWQADGGVLLLGRGVACRWEVAVEVDPDRRGKGLGRDLAAAARHLVPGGAPLWAQIAPGNAASVRAFLAAGFTPVGAEVLLPARPPAAGNAREGVSSRSSGPCRHT